jgi:hypothetical protein
MKADEFFRFYIPNGQPERRGDCPLAGEGTPGQSDTEAIRHRAFPVTSSG